MLAVVLEVVHIVVRQLQDLAALPVYRVQMDSVVLDDNIDSFLVDVSTLDNHIADQVHTEVHIEDSIQEITKPILFLY